MARSVELFSGREVSDLVSVFATWSAGITWTSTQINAIDFEAKDLGRYTGQELRLLIGYEDAVAPTGLLTDFDIQFVVESTLPAAQAAFNALVAAAPAEYWLAADLLVLEGPRNVTQYVVLVLHNDTGAAGSNIELGK